MGSCLTTVEPDFQSYKGSPVDIVKRLSSRTSVTVNFSPTPQRGQDVVISITPPTLLDFEHLSCGETAREFWYRPLETELQLMIPCIT